MFDLPTYLKWGKFNKANVSICRAAVAKRSRRMSTTVRKRAGRVRLCPSAGTEAPLWHLRVCHAAKCTQRCDKFVGRSVDLSVIVCCNKSNYVSCDSGILNIS